MECWGEDTYGQLGAGTTTNSPTPVPISGFSGDIVAIAVGYSHSCALTSAGGVECWGWNGETSEQESVTPVPVDGLSSGVIAITANGSTCALTGTGAAKCWGGNRFGQLGDGTNRNSLSPVPVSGLSSGVVAISAGVFDTCAVTNTGAATCWGYDEEGQLGNGTLLNSFPTPVLVSGLGGGNHGDRGWS